MGCASFRFAGNGSGGRAEVYPQSLLMEIRRLMPLCNGYRSDLH